MSAHRGGAWVQAGAACVEGAHPNRNRWETGVRFPAVHVVHEGEHMTPVNPIQQSHTRTDLWARLPAVHVVHEGE